MPCFWHHRREADNHAPRAFRPESPVDSSRKANTVRWQGLSEFSNDKDELSHPSFSTYIRVIGRQTSPGRHLRPLSRSPNASIDSDGRAIGGRIVYFLSLIRGHENGLQGKWDACISRLSLWRRMEHFVGFLGSVVNFFATVRCHEDGLQSGGDASSRHCFGIDCLFWMDE